MVCATSDQATSINFDTSSSPIVYYIPNADGELIGTGQTNTTNIVNYLGVGNYAAKFCDDLVLNGYSDWFLPSAEELNAIGENLISNNLGNFYGGHYWSSSVKPWTPPYALVCRLIKVSASGIGYQIGYDGGNGHRLRAVRNF